MKGYGEATLRDVATATGVLRGSLCNAYQDKETLFLHIVERYSRTFLSGNGNVAVLLAQPDIDRALADLRDFTINR
ncbi:TetR family transcriptional regulator [Actinacidiphila sp. bgisy167]|uniref:TetR family transcriptional regulator n=1 Tax=Actinacidiphila sp. bgisy167 TaxID=3413797 RepID=UPI003D72087D